MQTDQPIPQCKTGEIIAEYIQTHKEQSTTKEYKKSTRSYSEMAQYLLPSIRQATGVYEFTITPKGKKLLKQMLLQKKAPALLQEEQFNEGLCAGYIYELTSLLRGSKAPLHCGMLHPKTRRPADAWELPYTYWWRGGSIAFEIDPTIGQQIKKTPTLYPSLISGSMMQTFFRQAFIPQNFFGDVGFLYAETSSLRHLGRYDNYNSHITKNLGLSTFEYVLENRQGNAFEQLLYMLGCDETMGPHIASVFPYYQRFLNGEEVWISEEGQRFSTGGNVIVQQNDVVSYTDVTLVHFFEGPHVDSLLQLSCQGRFFPINVIQINPKFLEPFFITT